MPVPKPNTGESKDAFISRCISDLTKKDPKKPKEQISAICYDSWGDSKNAKSLCDELTERFGKIRALLINTFGERGRLLLDYTLVRLGVFDPKMERMNFAAIKGDMPIPFLKYESDGSAVIENLIFADLPFVKIDRKNKTVSGYANTMTADTYDDIWMPEAYVDSVKGYGDGVNLMHHKEMRAGTITESKIDQLGWKVKTKPHPGFWHLFEDGTLKGFSIGGWIRIFPDVIGRAYVASKRFSLFIDDLSYVTQPANKLSYFDDLVLSGVEKQSIIGFVMNSAKPMRVKNKALLKVAKSQSLDMTSTGNDAGIASWSINQQTIEKKKNNIGGKKLTDDDITGTTFDKDNLPKTSEDWLTYIKQAGNMTEGKERWEEYIRWDENQKALDAYAEKIRKREEAKAEIAINALPKRMEKLESSIEEIKNSMVELGQKFENIPEPKTGDTGNNVKSLIDKEIEKFERTLETGGIKPALNNLNKLRIDLRDARENQ